MAITISLSVLYKYVDPKKAKEMARKYNYDSISNGALMRCTPLAVWVSSLKDPMQIK